jgi:hypothetical protein
MDIVHVRCRCRSLRGRPPRLDPGADGADTKPINASMPIAKAKTGPYIERGKARRWLLLLISRVAAGSGRRQHWALAHRGLAAVVTPSTRG